MSFLGGSGAFATLYVVRSGKKTARVNIPSNITGGKHQLTRQILHYHQYAPKHLLHHVFTSIFPTVPSIKLILPSHPLIVEAWLHRRTLRNPLQNRRLAPQPAQHLPQLPSPLLQMPPQPPPVATFAPRLHRPTFISMLLEPANHLTRTVSVRRVRPLQQ